MMQFRGDSVECRVRHGFVQCLEKSVCAAGRGILKSNQAEPGNRIEEKVCCNTWIATGMTPYPGIVYNRESHS